MRLVLLGDENAPPFALDAPNLLIGRSPDNDIVVGEASVSARHARIDLRDGRVFLTDLGSTNGTFLGNHRVTGSVELQPGDTVALGRCLARLEDHGSAAQPMTVEPSAEPGSADPDELLWALRLASERSEAVPARRPLRLLASFDPADEEVSLILADHLSRLGHQVRHEPPPESSPGGKGRERRGGARSSPMADMAPDPWGGRLIDAMWATDAVLFVVSPAAAVSPRVHREVHLAGAERTPVLPVLIGPDELPEDLAYYLRRSAPVDLRPDPAAGLALLEGRLEGLRPKRVARPWQLARRVAAGAALLAMVTFLVLWLAF